MTVLPFSLVSLQSLVAAVAADKMRVWMRWAAAAVLLALPVAFV